MGQAETNLRDKSPLTQVSLDEYWMPFTPNREFKSDPKIVVRAEGMYYWSDRGHRIIDASSGLFCCAAGHVVIPAAMPEILTAMRISIGFGWTTLVAAEMVAATYGLGQMVLNASNFLRTDIVIMSDRYISVVTRATSLALYMMKNE